jgi:hypothetical protein
LEELIHAVRSPIAERPHRRRVTRSPVPAAETGARLDTLNAWLTPGEDSSSPVQDTEVLKAKLGAPAARAPSEAEKRASRNEVDRLKEKLQAEPTPAKRTDTKAAAKAETLARKLREKDQAPKGTTQKTAEPPAAPPPPKRDLPPRRVPELQPASQPLAVVPSPQPAPPARRQGGRDERRRRTDELCSIRWWRGYVKSSFYAVDPDDPETVIEESPMFRWLHGDPPSSDAAREAHRELVARLERDGWRRAGKGTQWFELRFRRRKVPARSAPAAAHRHDREEHRV